MLLCCHCAQRPTRPGSPFISPESSTNSLSFPLAVPPHPRSHPTPPASSPSGILTFASHSFQRTKEYPLHGLRNPFLPWRRTCIGPSC
ncbi:hypothetical protein COCSADRAFT_238810 [Bipolaris sorokiniana ND90Pr]|uniref:Uncharacterized protein n=1 Tax=Cochliobolus sativus (strain ND90Pr / ATCC 201652) TaxID=665912 RepID=M2SW36_COCSN|nr:uncharacterized protein COCSADRAFT_238810 [Bipolaris sorokiniana ND90Pr]EMD61052.1 hypothetical protein COCSADRAFT_238810 [Bipolaris sorokiniana ND90Pr]